MAQVVRGLPKSEDPNLLVGPATMDDAGVFRITEELALVQTMDFFPPLVDDPLVFGKIAAANALSDIYAMGGIPKTAMNLVGFPDDKLNLNVLHEILLGGSEQVHKAGAVLVGGHSVRDTEVKYGLSVTGVVDPGHMITNSGARPGDCLVLTKPLGTGFVTTAFKKKKCPDHLLQIACESMMELNAAGAEVMRQFQVECATDITGFGLVGHANELAIASGVTVVLNLETIPCISGADELVRRRYFTRASETNKSFVRSVVRSQQNTNRLIEEFIYDPQTSGGLLMCLASDKVKDGLKMLREKGCGAATLIGHVVEREEGVHIVLQ